ncbi:MAG: protein-L-isoaspartate(D-aspartate) O-methyltransferase [Thermoplasmata archaeon]|nr:protein-L-isoaspartate(D-aspartate) O-methyltransferase [Thermoplasmata archaeon]
MKSLEDLVNYLQSEKYIKSESVKSAFLNIDRKKFVPYVYKDEAYFDEPLPIGEDQTISAPHMVAIMLELANIDRGMKILEIGSGSGYNACLMEYLAYPGKVFTIERHRSLYLIAKGNIKSCPHSENIQIIEGDGSLGYSDEAPYDRIIVTCGAPDVPSPLLDQLKLNGLMIIPIGGSYIQELYLIKKTENGIEKFDEGPVAFVPLRGKYGFSKDFY